MCSYKEIFISPDELRQNKVLFKQIVMKHNDEILVKGKVLNESCSPLVGAVIEIIHINKNHMPPSEYNMGYVVTNTNGEYAITLRKLYNVDYRLDVFEPLIKA